MATVEERVRTVTPGAACETAREGRPHEYEQDHTSQVPSPDRLDDTFAYELPPLIKFENHPVIEYIDGEQVQFDPNALKTRDIHITDTTFRDGQQARPTPSTSTKSRAG